MKALYILVLVLGTLLASGFIASTYLKHMHCANDGGVMLRTFTGWVCLHGLERIR